METVMGSIIRYRSWNGPRCLFSRDEPREYGLALFVACLGGLKFVNLDARQKQRLYLTAAYVGKGL
jgi:hypothetical protein